MEKEMRKGGNEGLKKKFYLRKVVGFILSGTSYKNHITIRYENGNYSYQVLWDICLLSLFRLQSFR